MKTFKSFAILMPLALALGSAPAFASDTNDNLRARLEVDALQAELADDQATAQTLERQAASERAKATDVADIFGPSDEEKAAEAAAAQREQNQDTSIATLNQRAGDIEESLRRLTGEIEVLNHRLDEIDQRMDRMKKDFDYKLCQLSAQQLGAQAGGSDANAIPCTPAQTGSVAAPSEPAPPSGVTHLAPPPGVLGTIPQDANPQPPQPQQQSDQMAAPPAQPASMDTHTQFDAAMNMLAKSQYDAASGAFQSYADTYPKDPLAPQALYWVGDIAYVQKDYQNAAHAFAEALKKYPTSGRAPESMLKLGQSLIAMNQKQEGCTALHALSAKYPSASKSVLAQAEAVRKAGGCRR